MVMWSYMPILFCPSGPVASASYLEDETHLQKPNRPVIALMEEPNTLSHSFLIRQSCALSYESASRLYTHIYLALEDYCNKYCKGWYFIDNRCGFKRGRNICDVK